jgi:pyridoxine kinase
VPLADIITPNQFELEYLIGRKCGTLGDIRSALAGVHALGPRVIMVTSLDVEETPDGSVDLLASDAKACVRVRTPRLPQKFNGAGDTIAALFFARHLRRGDLGDALSKSASAVFGVLAKTAEAGTPELQLVAAQDELVDPSRTFDAEDITT